MTKAIQTEPGQARSCQSGRPIQPSSAHAKHTAGQARPRQPGQERERERKTEKETGKREKEIEREKDKERKRKREKEREREVEREQQRKKAKTGGPQSQGIHLMCTC